MSVHVVSTAADLPDAVRHAERATSSRWYVARRAKDLGQEHRIPDSWGLTAALAAYEPAPVVAAFDGDWTPPGRDKAAKKGQALEDGSFPIADKADLERAIKAYGRAKNKTEAKAHIIKRAKALKATSCLPDSWGVTASGAVTAAGTGWDPSLHPRDRKGRWIEKLDLLALFNGIGDSRSSARGTAVGSVRRGNKDYINVKVTATGEGSKYKVGDEIEIEAAQVESAPRAKARIEAPREASNNSGGEYVEAFPQEEWDALRGKRVTVKVKDENIASRGLRFDDAVKVGQGYRAEGDDPTRPGDTGIVVETNGGPYDDVKVEMRGTGEIETFRPADLERIEDYTGVESDDSMLGRITDDGEFLEDGKDEPYPIDLDVVDSVVQETEATPEGQTQIGDEADPLNVPEPEEYRYGTDRAGNERAAPVGPAKTKRETYKGRKLEVKVSKDKNGTRLTDFVNGQGIGTTYGRDAASVDKRMEQLRRDVDAADERRLTEPDAYGSYFYEGAPEAPATPTYTPDQEAADWSKRLADPNDKNAVSSFNVGLTQEDRERISSSPAFKVPAGQKMQGGILVNDRPVVPGGPAEQKWYVADEGGGRTGFTSDPKQAKKDANGDPIESRDRRALAEADTTPVSQEDAFDDNLTEVNYSDHVHEFFKQTYGEDAANKYDDDLEEWAANEYHADPSNPKDAATVADEFYESVQGLDDEPEDPRHEAALDELFNDGVDLDQYDDIDDWISQAIEDLGEGASARDVANRVHEVRDLDTPNADDEDGGEIDDEELADLKREAASDWLGTHEEFLRDVGEDVRADIEGDLSNEDYDAAYATIRREADDRFGSGTAADEFRERVLFDEGGTSGPAANADEPGTFGPGDSVEEALAYPNSMLEEVGAVNDSNADDEDGGGGDPDDDLVDLQRDLGDAIQARDHARATALADEARRYMLANGYLEEEDFAEADSKRVQPSDGVAYSPEELEALRTQTDLSPGAPAGANYAGNYPDDVRAEFDKWADQVRAESPEDAETRIQQIYDRGNERYRERVEEGSWDAVGVEAATAKGTRDGTNSMGDDRLAVFPVGDPRQYDFGGYEVWHTNEDGSKNGGRGSYPDRETAEAYIAANNAAQAARREQHVESVAQRIVDEGGVTPAELRARADEDDQFGGNGVYSEARRRAADRIEFARTPLDNSTYGYLSDKQKAEVDSLTPERQREYFGNRQNFSHTSAFKMAKTLPTRRERKEQEAARRQTADPFAGAPEDEDTLLGEKGKRVADLLDAQGVDYEEWEIDRAANKVGTGASAEDIALQVVEDKGEILPGSEADEVQAMREEAIPEQVDPVQEMRDEAVPPPPGAPTGKRIVIVGLDNSRVDVRKDPDGGPDKVWVDGVYAGEIVSNAPAKGYLVNGETYKSKKAAAEAVAKNAGLENATAETRWSRARGANDPGTLADLARAIQANPPSDLDAQVREDEATLSNFATQLRDAAHADRFKDHRSRSAALRLAENLDKGPSHVRAAERLATDIDGYEAYAGVSAGTGSRRAVIDNLLPTLRKIRDRHAEREALRNTPAIYRELGPEESEGAAADLEAERMRAEVGTPAPAAPKGSAADLTDAELRTELGGLRANRTQLNAGEKRRLAALEEEQHKRASFAAGPGWTRAARLAEEKKAATHPAVTPERIRNAKAEVTNLGASLHDGDDAWALHNDGQWRSQGSQGWSGWERNPKRNSTPEELDALLDAKIEQYRLQEANGGSKGMRFASAEQIARAAEGARLSRTSPFARESTGELIRRGEAGDEAAAREAARREISQMGDAELARRIGEIARARDAYNTYQIVLLEQMQAEQLRRAEALSRQTQSPR